MILKLYHGTLSLFDKIDVTLGNGYKDFGKGFYATPVKRSAEKFVRRNFERELLKPWINSSELGMYIYELELDTSILKQCRYKQFDVPNIEWLELVIENRESRDRAHRFDVISGPTADDDTRMSIDQYRALPEEAEGVRIW